MARLFFCGLAFALASGGPLLAAPVTQLKVLSFNIWVQGGLSLSDCIEAIRTSGADLVGLQECNATTAQTVASNLGFHVLPGNDCSIVSRYPILSTYTVLNTRGVTVLLGPGQRAHLFNCHLTAYPYGPYDLHSGQTQAAVLQTENATRMPELTQVLANMQSLLSGPEPCFLVGDFNAPSHLDYASFPWPTSVACQDAGLADSYRELHSANRTFPGPFGYQEPGITWTPKLNQEPEGVFDRIDFVHYSVGDGATPIASVELDERNSISPWPSDHRAVLSTFSVTPPTPLAKASMPTPANGATNVDLATVLSWLPGSNATSHAVYFGTSPPGGFLTNTVLTAVALSNLPPETVCYWRVDTLTPTGTAVGDLWSFTTRSTNAAVYEWTFSKGDLSSALGNGTLTYNDGATTSNLTTFGVTDGSTVPHISGKPARYLRAPAFTGLNNGYAAAFTGSGPNGGGSYINQFTMVFDLLLPPPLGWFPFFNTNPSNANDADFYIAPDGAIGIGPIGYSSAGRIAANTWYRVAFAADLAAGTVIYYINGTAVYAGTALLDGRHSLYSNQDPGPDLLLFNEGDTSGIYTHAVLLGSFFFTDRCMSSTEIAALGGPNARGILAAEPIRLSINAEPPNVRLTWPGGEGLFQVQQAPALTNGMNWQNVGSSFAGTNMVLPLGPSAAFFRVVNE